MHQLIKNLHYTLPLCFLFSLTRAQVPASERLDPDKTLQVAGSDGIDWYDPRKAPFELVGFEWIQENGLYRRLPVHPDWPIREAVDELANHTAGGQIRFRTNSKKILLRVHLRERSGMYHMPATGQSGFDLYILSNDEYRYLKTARFSPDTIAYEVEMFSSEKNNFHDFILNFPLYNGVDEVNIGLSQGGKIQSPVKFAQDGKIVIYGTSITQGGCVSRPGMAYSNILSRWLDVAFVNLGFSGNGRGEPELARLINQIANTRMIILDYEANAGETIRQTIGPFIDILREKDSEVPILVVSKIRYASASEGSNSYKMLLENRDFQRELVLERNKNGDRNIFFLDGSVILGDDYDECTVDGVHPTDLGSMKIAEAMFGAIENILK